MNPVSVLVLAMLAAPASDWPQSRHDAANTGSVTLEAPKSGEPRAWTFEGSGRTWGYEPGMTVWSSPAVAEVAGRAVLAVGSYDKVVYALDAATGERLWRFTTGGPVQSTPVLWNDAGRVWLYAASDDRLVYAIDAESGRQLWVHAVEDFRPTLGGARLSAPCVGRIGEEPVVFVGDWVWDRSLGNSLQRGAVTALGARDGKPRWRQVLGDNAISAPVYMDVPGRPLLLAGSSNGNVYALDPRSGAVLWNQTELDAVRAPPAYFEVAGRPLVFMASMYGTVRALDASSGAEVWKHRTGDRITGSPMVIEQQGRPLVVIGSYDRHLYAFEASNGRLAWSYGARRRLLVASGRAWSPAAGRAGLRLGPLAPRGGTSDRGAHAHALHRTPALGRLRARREHLGLAGRGSGERPLDGVCRELRRNLQGRPSRRGRSPGAAAALEPRILVVVPHRARLRRALRQGTDVEGAKGASLGRVSGALRAGPTE